MKKFLLAFTAYVLFLFWLAAPAFALDPASVNIITDPAVTVNVTRRKGNTSKIISVTVNQQDKVNITTTATPPPVVTPPPHMHGGVQGILHDHMEIASSDDIGFAPGIDTLNLSEIRALPNIAAPADWEQPGAVRTVCKPSHMNNDDAIVYPGQPGVAHDHTFFRPGADAFLTNANVRAAGAKSTCRGGIVDLTARWVPTMFNTVTMQAIIPQSLITYYKTTNCQYSIECSGRADYTAAPLINMHWPPKGMHLIAGDPTATTDVGHVQYSCFDGSGNGPTGPDMIACPPGNTLWVKVHFPECLAVNLDGSPVLDSPDHKSHAAYMQGWPDYNSPLPGKQYRCPTSHPHSIPNITMNVLFFIKPGMDTTKWNLSCGSTHCMHGDWFDGWDQDIMVPTNVECLQKRRDCGSYQVFDGRVANEFGGN